MHCFSEEVRLNMRKYGQAQGLEEKEEGGENLEGGNVLRCALIDGGAASCLFLGCSSSL